MTTSSREAAVKEARAAAARLHERHWQWIVDAALRSFEESVAKDERETVRHERFLDEAADGWSSLGESRAERLGHIKEVLEQRRAILLFLRAASRVLTIVSAEAFAQELRASGLWGRRSA